MWLDFTKPDLNIVEFVHIFLCFHNFWFINTIVILVSFGYTRVLPRNSFIVYNFTTVLEITASRHWDSSCYNRNDLGISPIQCSQSPSWWGFPTMWRIRKRTVSCWGRCPNSSTLCCRFLYGSVQVCPICSRL